MKKGAAILVGSEKSQAKEKGVPLILEEDLQQLKSAVAAIFSVINNIAIDKDETRRAKAIYIGDGLAASKKEDNQMLIDVPGVHVGKKIRKDGRFQGYCTISGQKIFCYGKTAEEVKKKIADMIGKGVVPKKKKRRTAVQLSAWIEKWMDLYKAPNVKPATLQNIRDVLKPAVSKLGGKDVGAVTAEELQKLLIGMSERMRDLCLTYLNQLFKKAQQLGTIKKNPCEAVEVKKHQSAHRNALTRQQQEDFLEAVKKISAQPLFVFLLQTGLRIGEALALTYADIDFERGTVSVNKDVVFINGKRIDQPTPKSAAGVRSVPVPEEAMLLIPRGKEESALVFPYTYAGARSAFRRVSELLGYTVTAHMLRHTYATRLEEAGISPKIKQYLLGHSTSRMTQEIYTHVQKDFINEKAELIRSAFRKE